MTTREKAPDRGHKGLGSHKGSLCVADVQETADLRRLFVRTTEGMDTPCVVPSEVVLLTINLVDAEGPRDGLAF